MTSRSFVCLLKCPNHFWVKLLCCPAILRESTNMIRRKADLLILGKEVKLVTKDNKGQEGPANYAHKSYANSPLRVTLLPGLRL